MADPKITIRVEGSGLPQGGSDGQVLTRQDGKAVWGDAQLSVSEAGVISLMLEMNALPTLVDASGAILTDNSGAIVLG